ncbi:hypothetical protein [Rhodococcus sp. NPDC058521]|uniref:hypothetical protein n=1 Tax=Rhodococcus sp. NPDC058521 TaxID=3346536 RepID=UPI00365E3A5D
MELDVEAVNGVGAGFVDVAEALYDAAAKTRTLEFTGARAGREYASEGTALHEGMLRIASVLDTWSASSGAFGESVLSATARVVDTDRAHADDVNRVDR